MGKKIYCLNCKWFQTPTQIIFNGGYDCVFVRKENDYITGYIGVHRHCMFTNKDGLCRDYQRKWWKFWV